MKIDILKKDSSKGLKFLNGINRPVSPSHVTKISNSIGKMGLIRPVVVAKIDFLDERGVYIVDGQHLFYALMRLGMDIPYTTITIKNEVDLIEKISLLNASSKSWAILDYITAWSYISPEYKKLHSYYNTYDFELCFTAGVLSDLTTVQGGNTQVSNAIKKGKFKINNEPAKKRILDNLTEVFTVISRMNRLENRYFCNEYYDFIKIMGGSYNHEKFMIAMAKKKLEFVLATQEPGKLVETFKKIM